MKTMPAILQLMLRDHIQAITLPPVGIYTRPGLEDNPRLLAHEMTHWAQYQRLGVFKFYALYLWYSARYGYYANPMEVEARTAEEPT
jgi:hypothetical protein